jgi:hypothetical protein
LREGNLDQEQDQCPREHDPPGRYPCRYAVVAALAKTPQYERLIGGNKFLMPYLA